MSYVDGFVSAVPTVNREAYKALALTAAAVFRECGATRIVECWGDDVPEGEVTSFTMAVKREPHESIVFSWVEWPSREARDAGMKVAMADPRMAFDTASLPFDGQRMIFGGFEPIVNA